MLNALNATAKRPISLMIAAAVLLSAIFFISSPVPAFAADGDFATGMTVTATVDSYAVYDTDYYAELSANYAADDTFLAGTAGELAAIAKFVNEGNDFSGKTVIMTADIDLGGEGLTVTRTPAAGNFTVEIGGNVTNAWTPIGNDIYPFSGTFIGGNHTVRNMVTVETPAGHAYAGLFGYVDGGSISGVTVGDDGDAAESSCSVAVAGLSTRIARAGGIAGNTENGGIITNCAYTGGVYSSSAGWYSYAGGIVGIAYINSSIANCTNAGEVYARSASGSDSYAGGIAGRINNGFITNCANTGDIYASSVDYSSYAGGIAGYVYGSSITNCYNTGDVYAYVISSYAYVGGITGCVSNGSGGITNCYNTGAVRAIAYSNSYAGGLAGYVDTSNSNSYNTGNVTAQTTRTTGAPQTYAGGAVGNNYGTLTALYNTGDVTAADNHPTADSVAGGIMAYGFGSVTGSWYDSLITLTSDAAPLQDGSSVVGLDLVLIHQNYKVNTLGNDVFDTAAADYDAWHFFPITGGIGLHPELKLMMKKASASIATDSGTLTANVTETGFLGGVDMGELTYRWYRNGAPIAGADEQTYDLTAADANCVIWVKIEAENYKGEIAAFLETTAPEVTATVPADEADDVSAGLTEISVTFSEAMDKTVNGVVSLAPGNETIEVTAYSWNAAGTVLTATFPNALDYATEYTLTVSGFGDLAGNAMEDEFTSTFTTEEETPITPDKTKVRNLSLTVTAPKKGAVPSNTAVVTVGGNRVKADSVTWTGNFGANGTFKAGEVYTVKIKVSLTDTDKYEWANGVTVTVNGKTARFDPITQTVTYTFAALPADPPADKPSDKPSTGTNPLLLTIPHTGIYTITLDADGGTGVPLSIGTDTTGRLPFLPEPTKDGAVFAGWFTEEDGGGKQVTKYTVFTNHTTIYALWK